MKGLYQNHLFILIVSKIKKVLLEKLKRKTEWILFLCLLPATKHFLFIKANIFPSVLEVIVAIAVVLLTWKGSNFVGCYPYTENNRQLITVGRRSIVPFQYDPLSD